MVHYLVEKWTRLFRETGNPIYAFRAFQNARRLRLPIPEEILQFLDGVTDRVIKIANNPPAPKDRPLSLQKALGMGKEGAGQGSVFSDYATLRFNREIALKTYSTVLEWGAGKEDHAFEEVAKEYKISKSTIRRNFKSHLKTWEARAALMIESGMIDYGTDGKPRMQVIGESDDFREAGIILELIDTPPRK